MNLNDHIVDQRIVTADAVFSARVTNRMKGDWDYWRGLRALQGDTRDWQQMLLRMLERKRVS